MWAATPLRRHSWGIRMTDARTLDERDEDEQEDEHRSDRRGLWNVLVIAIIVIIVILVLLMLRGCDGIMDSARHGSATNEIVPVSGSNPLSGKVSIWVEPKTPISQVLAAAGISGATVDMGAGRYVVDVPAGSEVENVRLLRDTKGVYDAGRVYMGPSK